MAASAIALGRGVRTGLDRPGDACHLISRTGSAVDVTRDAGDVATHIELDLSVPSAMSLYFMSKLASLERSRPVV